MNIGIFCHNYPPHPGGLEVIVQNVAAGLASENQVTVLSTAWNGKVGSVREERVRVERVPAIHLTESFGVPYPVPTGRRLRAALRVMEQHDVLHAHGGIYVTSLLAARISRRLRKPLVLTEHVGFVEYSNPLLNLIQRLSWAVVGNRVIGSVDALVAYNARVHDWLQGRYPGTAIHFVPNGVDGDRFRPLDLQERRDVRQRMNLPENEMLVLFAGRESEKKNLAQVLEIPRTGFRLVVCGAKRSLPPDVIDLGLLPHDQMPGLFGAVDVMLHAATGEGFPVAVQEAISCGLPLVLLWDVGYGRSLDRGVAATCDRLADLEPNLRKVLTSAELRADLSRRGRAWAREHWSWERTVASHLELYRAAQEGSASE